MARRREEKNPSSWLATLASLGVLILVGFGVGVVAGILWEEPRLVLAHLTGGTTEITWTADSRGRTAAPEPAATEPAPPEPQEPPAVELPAVAAAPRGRVAIQVGAFAESAAAEKLAKTLRDGGYAVYVTPGARSDTPRWRVRVGPFADRDEAERVATRLKSEQKLPTWVLDEDGG
ncbi:MAG TPA: SPOR domain-containing protein [Myxococcota bacterium]